MMLPGVVVLVIGYALFYTGVSNLSGGSFTGGNVQGLATSLGLDKLATKAADAANGRQGLKKHQRDWSQDTPADPATPAPINTPGTIAT